MVDLERQVFAPLPSVIYGTDEEACRKRRQARMNIIRRKRQRCMANIPSHSSSNCDSSVSSASLSVYTLTKDEIRRKKNRESAERSRQRKLGLIEYLTRLNKSLSVKLLELTNENECLRGRGNCEKLSTSTSPSMADDSDYGDLSTISSSSSASSTPPSSTQLPAGQSLCFSYNQSFSHIPQTNYGEADLTGIPQQLVAVDTSNIHSTDLTMTSSVADVDWHTFAWLPVMDEVFQFSELLDFDTNVF